MLCKHRSIYWRGYNDRYFARAGSCCQIGKSRISAGSGVGGVLEPAQALPTIIEDNALGAMSEVVEGVIVGEGSVLSMGMYIGQQ